MASECDCCSSTEVYCTFITKKGVYTSCEKHYLPMCETCESLYVIDREFAEGVIL